MLGWKRRATINDPVFILGTKLADLALKVGGIEALTLRVAAAEQRAEQAEKKVEQFMQHQEQWARTIDQTGKAMQVLSQRLERAESTLARFVDEGMDGDVQARARLIRDLHQSNPGVLVDD